MADSEIRKLDIERYAAGELAGPAAAALEEHLRTCAACQGYYARLRREREAFLHEHPFADLRTAGAVGESGELWYERLLKPFVVPVLRPVLVPLCVLVLLGAMIVPFVHPPLRLSTIEEGLRYKGVVAPLSYMYKRSGVIHEGGPQDQFKPGDRIQIFYSSPQEQYLTLFSVDGTGAVSFYQPDVRSAVCSIRSGTGSHLAYPVSIELDSVPGAELVVALLSDDQFDTNRIKKWVYGLDSRGDITALEKKIAQKPLGEKSTVSTLVLQR